MAGVTYKTKAELRTKLLIRLGYGGLGTAAAAFVPMADDLLEEANEQCFQLLFPDDSMGIYDFNSAVDTRWYDIPQLCDPDKIDMVHAEVSGTWIPMTKGIYPEHDSVFDDITSYPQRWDIRWNDELAPTAYVTPTIGGITIPSADSVIGFPQFEIWPKPDAVYKVRVEGQRRLTPFVYDSDRVYYDDRLILLYAVAKGKEHLRHPDAGAAMSAFNMRLRLIRGNEHNRERYIRGDVTEVPLAYPQVVNPDTSTSGP